MPRRYFRRRRRRGVYLINPRYRVRKFRSAKPSPQNPTHGIDWAKLAWNKYGVKGAQDFIKKTDAAMYGYSKNKWPRSTVHKYFNQLPDFWGHARDLYDDFNQHWFGRGR